MKTKWIEKSLSYDGSQLRSHFSLTTLNVQGASIVAFRGPCKVSLKSMVDYEDLLSKSEIRSHEMLHFIIEFFPTNLKLGVALQRLLASIVADLVQEQKSFQAKSKVRLHRDGDDLYLGSKKLSISIASQSAVSTMIHFAVNITTKGTPVPTCALEDWGINPKSLAMLVMKKFSEEYVDIVAATEKVKPLS